MRCASFSAYATAVTRLLSRSNYRAEALTLIDHFLDARLSLLLSFVARKVVEGRGSRLTKFRCIISGVAPSRVRACCKCLAHFPSLWATY